MTSRLIPIVCISLLSACAGNAVKDSDSIQQSAMQQAKAIEQTPEMVIAESQALQLEAQKADLYFYSPSYMEQAEDALEDAEDAIKSKKLAHEIIAYALTAKKLFNRGLENKATVLKQLSASFDGLAMLKEIETDTVLPSDFQDLRDDTKDLIILIEQGKTTKAINDQKELLTDISEVEIKTLKKTYLSVAENALEKAEDADADDYAAKSFSDAQKNIETFEMFIESSAKQREQIKQKSLQAIRLAQHAEHVSKAAVPLLKLNNETAEEHILFIENLMKRIAVALQQDDVSHLNLNSQSLAIAQTAETINKLASAQTQPAIQEKMTAAEHVLVSDVIEETQTAATTPAADTNDTKSDLAATGVKTESENPLTQDLPANTENKLAENDASLVTSTDTIADTSSSTLPQVNTEEQATITEAPTITEKAPAETAAVAPEIQLPETERDNTDATHSEDIAQSTDTAELANVEAPLTQVEENTTEESETVTTVEAAEVETVETSVETGETQEEAEDEVLVSTPETTNVNNAVAADQAL